MSNRVSYLLGQRAAQELDIELMQVPGFSIDQLMELAGLAVAASIAAAFSATNFSRTLVIAGPGNNGGDGLVAARHLSHFGYKPTILYPKDPKPTGNGPLYTNLLKQCGDLDIPVLKQLDDSKGISATDFDLVIDGIFGFSFNGANGIRAPFDTILKQMIETKVPVASIDIPSGWDVEKGDLSGGSGLQPAMLISLTAPKLCAVHFAGEFHYLGGRFLPPKLAKKYGLEGLPKFQGTDQCVRLPALNLTPSGSDEEESCKM